MNKLPYGWTEGYALTHVMGECKRLIDIVDGQQKRIDYLEAELTRLDMTKADRAGRPRKATAQADARKESTP